MWKLLRSSKYHVKNFDNASVLKGNFYHWQYRILKIAAPIYPWLHQFSIPKNDKYQKWSCFPEFSRYWLSEEWNQPIPLDAEKFCHVLPNIRCTLNKTSILHCKMPGHAILPWLDCNWFTSRFSSLTINELFHYELIINPIQTHCI